jgi:hypothetical protein
MQKIQLIVTYPKDADVEKLAEIEENFAKEVEQLGCTIEFVDILEGTLPRPRKPKN